MLLGISGICAAANISPLLSCMVFGAANITEALSTVGVIGFSYFINYSSGTDGCQAL